MPIEVPQNPVLARVPRCYDEVRICQFCSQFFQASSDNVSIFQLKNRKEKKKEAYL